MEARVLFRALCGPAAACVLLALPVPAQTLLYRIEGPAAGAEYGTSLVALGDLDGDGADDFAVGAPREASSQGAVRIHSGRTGAVLATLVGTGPADYYGQDLSALDDVDGDGVRELLVGAPERAVYVGDCEAGGGGFGPAQGAGYVQVVSGASLAVLYTLPAPGGPTDVFGFSLAGGGDVDADGDADFIVPLGLSNAVNLYDGASGALLRSDSFPPGWALYDAAFLGQVDGTPGEEYVVGFVDYAGCFSGGLRALRGANGSPFWTDSICVPGDEYGWYVHSVGDLNGDGLRDVVGCAVDSGGFACLGFGYLRALSGLDGSLFYSSLGAKFGVRGKAVCDLGDLNGDGSDDLAVSEPGIFGNGQNLRVQNGFPGTPFLTLAPGDPTDRYGLAVAAGDLNGDGLRDLLVGAPHDDDAGVQAGSVEVHTVWVGVTPYCEAQVNSQGCTPSIFATGMPSLSYNNFRVKATGVLNQKSGILFWGAQPKQTAFGGGWLCVLSPVVRTEVQSSGGNPPPDDCSGAFSFHFNKPYMTQKGLSAGTPVYCQYWSRDPSSPATTNLTDALAFSVEP